jgi:hypothetical protein
MVDFLLSIVGLASLGGAIYEFYKFVTDPNPGGGHTNGWIALVLAVVFCACALLLFLRHVNKEEEIHITQSKGCKYHCAIRMIACNRLVEANSTDRRRELHARDRRRTHYQATPFASAAMARANGRFCF